ncbi:hypothetical protein [Rhodococcus triatomae]
MTAPEQPDTTQPAPAGSPATDPAGGVPAAVPAGQAPTTPAAAPADDPNPASPLADLGIDLGGMLNDASQSVDLTIDALSGGLDIDNALEIGGGVDVSVSAPGGIPQVSVDGGGQLAAGGQFDTYGNYDDIDVTTDADTGTTDANIESMDGSAAGYGGVQAGAEFGVDLSASPTDGGIPGIGISGELGFGTQSGLDLDGSYSDIDLHNETGSGYGNDLGM